MKKTTSAEDKNTIRFQNLILYIFAISSLILVFTTKNILFVVVTIVLYLLFAGIWAIVKGRYYFHAGGEFREKMYIGTEARLIGFAHIMAAAVFIYYLW